MSEINLTPCLENGLTPFVPKNPSSGFNEVRNSNSLIGCRNAHPLPGQGFAPLKQMTYFPTTLTQTPVWPHEQLLRLDKTILLMRATSLFEVNPSTRAPGRVSAGNAEPLYLPSNNASAATIASNTKLWQGVGFQHMYFLTNGESFVYKVPSAADESDSQPKILSAKNSTDNITVNMICKHQERLIVGGIAGTILADSAYLDLFRYWKDMHGENVAISEDTLPDASWFMFSGRAGDDTDLPFVVMLAVLGLIESAKRTRYLNIARTLIEEGTFGWAPTRRGTMLKAGAEYGEKLLIMGDGGVHGFNYIDGQGYVEDASLIHENAVRGRGAVAGNGRKVLWIDNQGRAHRMTLNDGYKCLGHERSLTGLNNGDGTIVCMDTDDEGDWFWCGDGTDGYCITPSETIGRNDALIPSSLLRMPNSKALYGTFVAKSDPQPMEFETETRDEGQSLSRQVGEVAYVNVSTSNTNATLWTITVKARQSKGDALTTYTAKGSDGRGRHRMKAPFTEYRIAGTTANYKEADLTHLGVELGGPQKGKKLSLRQLHDA